jgi:hypothetical protein
MEQRFGVEKPAFLHLGYWNLGYRNLDGWNLDG